MSENMEYHIKCSQRLMKGGHGAPRTCIVCGLGPCRDSVFAKLETLQPVAKTEVVVKTPSKRKITSFSMSSMSADGVAREINRRGLSEDVVCITKPLDNIMNHTWDVFYLEPKQDDTMSAGDTLTTTYRQPQD
jgi:hypothetical protein